ncbi:hypothetical protein GCM10008994_24000 [Halorubrum ejinorense]
MSERVIDISSDSVSARSRRGFLTALTSSAGLLALSAGSGAASKNPRTGATLRDTSEQAETEIPPYPDDPFIQPAFGIQYLLGWENFGWEAASNGDIQETVLGLHPDVLAFDQLLKYEYGRIDDSFRGYRRQFTLAENLNLPATSGMNVHIETDEEKAQSRYGPVAEESGWEFPDGTPVESPLDILGETFDGEPHQTEFEFETLGTPSVFAPGSLELLLNATVTQFESGYSGFFVDGVGVFRLHGLDFSRWARSAFRSHLGSLSGDKLSTFGVDDPQSFDVHEYLRENGLAPEDDADPREDPVFREYLLHQHEGIDGWFEDYRSHIEEEFPERTENGDIALYANQFTGNLRNPQAPNIYVSDSMDMIYTELFPTGDPASDVNYKIMRSVGNFSKPVIAKGTLSARSRSLPEEMDPRAANDTFQRFQLAEAYSTGARFQLPLTNRQGYSEEESVTNWVNGDGVVPEELSSFVDFLWAHKRFLTGLEPAGDVALVWSLPTHVWRQDRSWDFGGDDERGPVDAFTGAANALREAGFTYDVLTFGHPRLWDDADQLSRLSEYDSVVLAGVECLSDEQVAALRTYLDAGGTILCTDAVPDRDSMYRPRSDVKPLFERDGAAVVTGPFDRQRESEDESESPLPGALEERGVEPARRTDDADIAVHAHSQSDPDRTVIPLVNYDYDPESDSVSTKSEVRVRLPETADTEAAVRYYSPGETTDLEVAEREGSRRVTVPKLVEWGIIVAAEAPEDLAPETSEGSALDAIEAARASIKQADERDEVTRADLVVGNSKAQAAETAMSFEAYGQAKAAAAEAIDAVGGRVDEGGAEAAEAEGENNDDENVSDEENATGGNRSETDDDTPGFGIGTAVTALGGAAYLLKSQLFGGGGDKKSS